jgi:uncharacterized protein involved in response to NO
MSAEREPATTRKQAEFRIDYVYVATAAALFIGFAVGAHVASVIGFDFPLGKGFYSFVQTHGHVQLVGWVGLFIIGISLHFIPRLAGVSIAQPRAIDWVLWLIASGLMLRSVAHCVVPYLDGSSLFTAINWLNVVSGMLELAGILVYMMLCVQTIRRVDHSKSRPGLTQVAPLFIMVQAGFLTYMCVNLASLLRMVATESIVINQAWNEFAIQIFIGLVILPVAMAFSVRLFPLYLRLPAVEWSVCRLAAFYLGAFCLQVFYSIPPIAVLESRLPVILAHVGAILKSIIILGFVWKLDLFTRRGEPWTVNRVQEPGPKRRPTRPGMPDYGEFGRFERLVYAAYCWLVFGAIFEIVSSASFLLGHPWVHSTDALRHIYLIGFATHLILGMSVRMIPGFMKKKRIASPRLVEATFWLGNIAAVFRVVPLLLPIAVFEAYPWMVGFMQAAFGSSGILALLAIFCLTVNLWRTV